MTAAEVIEREGLHLYAVVSPVYGEVMPLLDDGTGPIEYGRDFSEILAKNAADAKALVVSLWLKGGYRGEGKWARDNVRQGESPYRGVTVELIDCYCSEIGPDECPIHQPRSWRAVGGLSTPETEKEEAT